MGAYVWAQTVQIENLRRIADILEKQRPKIIPCHECGKPIPVKRIIIRDYKVICEKCYEKLYMSKKPLKKQS